MLEHAKAQAQTGRAVYVVAANEAERVRLEQLLAMNPMGVKVEAAGTLGNLQWDSMTLRGAHPNCLVLCDHYAIECRFRAMLEELHRYDQ
jgi:hypothetical protein